MVVKLAGQVLPFVFLCGDQPLRQQAHLPLGVLGDGPLIVGPLLQQAEPRHGDERHYDSEQEGLPQQPAELGAKRLLPARNLGTLRFEIGIVQRLDILCDVENRLSSRHHFPSEKAGASKDLFIACPIEQWLERLPIAVEL